MVVGAVGRPDGHFRARGSLVELGDPSFVESLRGQGYRIRRAYMEIAIIRLWGKAVLLVVVAYRVQVLQLGPLFLLN